MARKKKIQPFKQQSFFSLKNILLIIIALVVIGYLSYSVMVYQESGGQEEGIVACSQDNTCTLSVHWHTRIHAEACGKKLVFSLEEGNLGEQHTHKERDITHLHTSLPYNPLTKTITDRSLFRLGNFFHNLGIEFSSHCIGTYCTQTPCPDGKRHKLIMLVNGKPTTQFENYEWKDGDEILIKTIPE